MREKFSKKYREDFSASPRFWPDLFWWIAAAVITWVQCFQRWLYLRGMSPTVVMKQGCGFDIDFVTWVCFRRWF
jgi:hypothetical protein